MARNSPAPNSGTSAFPRKKTEEKAEPRKSLIRLARNSENSPSTKVHRIPVNIGLENDVGSVLKAAATSPETPIDPRKMRLPT
jgi:hypothetical protein